jgi:alcohol dehydrogenase
MKVSFYRFPTQVIFGESSLGEIGNFVPGLGGRCLLVTGCGPTSRHPGLKTLKEILRESGKAAIHFHEVDGDPDIETVEKGVELARGEECDFVIAFGGGSPLDTAKIIAAKMNNPDDDISSWEGVGKIKKKPIPLICVPTTAGPGSEATGTAVIRGGRDKRKMAIVSRHLFPYLSVVDPTLTYSLPPELSAETGMDALAHAVESYVAKRAWGPTRALSRQAVRLIFTHLERACEDGEDREARRSMCMASFMAGMASDNAGLGLVHALSHALGGRYGVPHAKADALLLPHVMRFNLESCPELYRDLAEAMGRDTAGKTPAKGAEEAVKAVEELASVLPLPRSLAELGIVPQSIESLAAEAFLFTRFRFSNPRETVLEDLAAVLEEAV